MGQFSMEILGCAGSVLSGNQHVIDDIEHAKAPPAGELVVHEVE